MELWIVKTISVITLLFGTLFFSLLPVLIASKVSRTFDPHRRHLYKNAVSFLSCFGGGVFLGTCLLDLFPEVEEQFAAAFKVVRILTSFPLAEFVMIVGFLLVLITEQVTLSWKENNPEETHPLLGHSHDHRRPSFSRQRSLEGINDHVLSHEDLGYSIHEDPSSHSSLRSALLVIALSLHSIFEGLAIGLQPNDEDVAKVLTAVFVHKSIIAFTLGLNLVHSKLRRRTIFKCAVLFSVTSPLGLALGMLVMNFEHGVMVSVMSGILQGLACGTFLYVTFFEVLPHELNSGEQRILKLLFVILGFTFISLLILFLPG